MLWLSSGCNDAPDSVGTSILKKEDYGIVQVDTFYTTVVQPTLPTLLSTESIDRIMLGKYRASQNQTYEAWTCIKFYGWPDSLLGATITSARILLKPFYNFGDSSSSLSINVLRAKASFLGDSLTFDSLNLNSNHYYNSTSINTATIQLSDTLCPIDLDIAVVREWFISNTDTTDRNDGLILRPTNANVIKGFYSFNASDTAFQPTLYITYIDTNGIAGAYTHKTGISKYVAHVDPNLFLNNSDGKIRVQNGISYRGLVAFEDLSLPWSTPWAISIHKAVLQITLDSASSSSRFTPFANDLIYGLSVGSNDQESYYTTSVKSTNRDGQHVYQFDVTNIASSWLKNTSTRRFAFSGFFESGSFDLFTFYGAGSSIAQRPKVIITYSIKR